MKVPLKSWWFWAVALLALLVVVTGYAILVPRLALKSYKRELAARGILLTPEAMADAAAAEEIQAAVRFIQTAERLPDSKLLRRLGPPLMGLVGPAEAQAGWRQPRLRLPPASDGSYTSRMMQRYGLVPSPPSASAGSGPVLPATWDELAAEIEAVDPVIREIRESAQAGHYRWVYDYSQGFDTRLPHLSKCKDVIQWLSAATGLALHEGRLDDALELIETELLVCHASRSAGGIIGELLRLAMIAITWNATWEALQADGWTEEQLARMQTAWESTECLGGMISGLQSERLMILVEYERCRRTPSRAEDMLDLGYSGSFNIDVGDGLIGEVFDWMEEKLPRQQEALRARIWAWFQSYHDERCYLEVSESYRAEIARRVQRVTASEVPPANPGTPIRPWIPEAILVTRPDLGGYPFASATLPTMDNLTGKAFRIQTQQQMAVAAIALERHLLRHGTYPEDLAQLVPEFVSSVPVDWMDGQPLRYQLLEPQRFLLYSVSDNGTDGGDAQSLTDGRNSFNLSTARDLVWPREVLPPLLSIQYFDEGHRLDGRGVEQTLRTRLLTNQPPVWITLVSQIDSTRQDTEGHAAIGFIEVAKGSPPTLEQTLFVWGADPASLKTQFRLLDLNFDGYVDFCTLYEPSAQAARLSLWLYNPETGRYETNALTTQLRDIAHHTMTLDPVEQTVRFAFFSGICTNSWELCRIREGRIWVDEAELHEAPTAVHCRVTRLRRIDNEVQVVGEDTHRMELP